MSQKCFNCGSYNIKPETASNMYSCLRCGALSTQRSAMTAFEKASLAISAAGFIAVIASLIFLWAQTNQIENSLTSTAYQNAMSQQLELDKIFSEEENLEYWKYFQEGVPLTAPKQTEEYTKTKALAVLKINVLDVISEQISYNLKVNDPDWYPWDNYFYGSFASSPVLCETLKEAVYSYTGRFVILAREACSVRHKIDIYGD